MAHLSPAARAAAYNEYEFDDNDSIDLDNERVNASDEGGWRLECSVKVVFILALPL